jgi:FtsH-binding integral membrane protein
MDTTTAGPEQTRDHRALDRKINGRTGGGLLIWLGLALLLGLGWGVGLIGVGAILLAEQLVRRNLALEFAWFWVIAGMMAVVLGLALVIGLQDALVPVLLLVAGGVLIASTFRD